MQKITHSRIVSVENQISPDVRNYDGFVSNGDLGVEILNI